MDDTETPKRSGGPRLHIDIRQVIASLRLFWSVPFRRYRKITEMSTDRNERKAEVFSIAAVAMRRVGWSRLSGLLQSGGRREEMKAAAAEATAREVAEQLGQMKGLPMKFGQMMSYLNVAGEEIEEHLSQLQQSVPPMSQEQLDAILHQRFDGKVDEIFDSFETTPVAAASIGQVHRARLRDGRLVAVKLQYPGVEEAFMADLDHLDEIVSVTASTSAMASDLNEYWEKLAEKMLAELDYNAEQRAQQRLADLYKDHPFVVVPNTVPELCSRSVLVTDFIDGERLQEAVHSRDAAELSRLGEIMYRFTFGSVANNFFSGDPHPGNFLFPNDGRVCFLDFGMVLEFTDDEHFGRISELLATEVGPNHRSIDGALRNVGLLWGDADAESVWKELRWLIAGPIDADDVVPIDREAFRSGMKALQNPQGEFVRMMTNAKTFESWIALWFRYATGSLATISKLQPRANWRRIMQEIVLGAPPETEVGREWGAAPGGSEFAGSRAPKAI